MKIEDYVEYLDTERPFEVTVEEIFLDELGL